MKVSRRQLRNLINEALGGINQKAMAAGQHAYDNMEDPAYNQPARASDSAADDTIFDYALDNLFDELVDAAVQEGVITFEDAESMEESELVAVLKGNFKSDIYEDEYNSAMELDAEYEAGEAQANDRDWRDDYDDSY